MQHDPLPPPFDHTGLPVGLPETVYSSWIAARRDFRDSKDLVLAAQRYEFCLGYVQALEDTQIVDERICGFLKEQLREIWAVVLDKLPSS